MIVNNKKKDGNLNSFSLEGKIAIVTGCKEGR